MDNIFEGGIKPWDIPDHISEIHYNIRRNREYAKYIEHLKGITEREACCDPLFSKHIAVKGADGLTRYYAPNTPPEEIKRIEQDRAAAIGERFGRYSCQRIVIPKIFNPVTQCLEDKKQDDNINIRIKRKKLTFNFNN